MPSRRIGDWSYSHYLRHWPLLVLLAARLERNLATREGLWSSPRRSFRPYLSYHFVEEPGRRAVRLRRTWPPGDPSPSLSSLLSLSVGALRPERLPTGGSLANALRFSESSPRSVDTLGAGVLPDKPRGAAAVRPTRSSWRRAPRS